MLVFCLVHLKRNFAKKFPNHELKHVVDKIFNADTERELLFQMDNICITWPQLKPWINSKRAAWIMAGLSKARSKIPIEWWDFARKHTGIEESSHFQDNNYTGRKLSLLAAVMR